MIFFIYFFFPDNLAGIPGVTSERGVILPCRAETRAQDGGKDEGKKLGGWDYFQERLVGKPTAK